MAGSAATPVLAVDDLRVVAETRAGRATIVEGVSFAVARGETLALVGESGCGKTMTALSVMRLLPEPPCRIAGGAVRLAGQDLLTLSEREMCRVRGRRVAMIFQEPMTALNPVRRVGRQIVEALTIHGRGRGARDQAIELLRLVGLPDPAQRVDEYPHRLSGGQRQRVMIAIALACQPEVLVADEPTTALDVTIQAQILELLRDLQRRLGLAIVFITHDLGLVAECADRVAVMYAGRIVETGQVAAVLAAPAHPYTHGLLNARPRPRTPQAPERSELAEIKGSVPRPGASPAGCPFAPRCPLAVAACRTAAPSLAPYADGRTVACLRAGEIGARA